MDKITKVEVLWTYKCCRECKGCAMNSGEVNTRTLDDWKKGILNFKALGAKFLCVYGAEPLMDFDNLPEVIQFAESIGIDTTVITSFPFTEICKEYLQILYKNGLRSLTTSFDPISYDHHSEAKTHQALDMLKYFQSLGPVRDTAAVVTVTSDNLQTLPGISKLLTSEGIWMFCDLMHWDRGNKGTKCKGEKRNIHLDYSDLDEFKEVYHELLDMKKDGALIHIDPLTVKKIEDDNLHFSWNCSSNREFPSWITVDPHGEVFPCDDFKPKGNKKFDMTDICKRWRSFEDFWKKQVKYYCKGCLWSTHIQSHSVKRGLMDIKDFIHDNRKNI